MRPVGPGVQRGPRSTRLHFPERGHDMINDARVKRVAYDFLAGAGRHPPRALPAEAAAAE
jgi:hypothetical protein